MTGSEPESSRERLSWEGFGVASRRLAERIHDDGYEPDLILSVARGGLLVGGALAYALGVKNVDHERRVLHRCRRTARSADGSCRPSPSSSICESARMLIADDVADTGETLRLVKDFCSGKVAEVRCAVLYEKARSLVACEYVWKRTDLWIDFPWSAQTPVSEVPARSAG